MTRLAFRPTLLGRSVLLITLEVLANTICWVVAAILYARENETKSIMYLALLAWLWMRIILGEFRNSIESERFNEAGISMKCHRQCNKKFDHTIVIVVTVAIAISSEAFDKMNKVGDIGRVVGAAVSGSFLFIVGLANSVILWRIIRRRRREATRQRRIDNGEQVEEMEHEPHHNQTIMLRILGPVVSFVNRPWKMYPVGVLFGFGFDTASSIALLGLSAIAKRGTDGSIIPSSHIIILPLLFTSGMSLVDSADSILMLYSYSGFPERSWALIERTPPKGEPALPNHEGEGGKEANEIEKANTVETRTAEAEPEVNVNVEKNIHVKMNVMSSLSIILTLMSILVAFSISLITIMGLIGERCTQCAAAADAKDGGGLAGSWWRAWARATERSGYIGAALVGIFLVIVVGWYGTRFISRKLKAQTTSGV